MKQYLQKLTVEQLFLGSPEIEFELKNTSGHILNFNPDMFDEPSKPVDILSYYRGVINAIFNNSLNRDIALIKNDTDDGIKFTVVDGLKRLMAIDSFLKYHYGLLNDVYFNNLNKDYQDKISNFKFEVAITELSSEEELDDNNLITIYNYFHPLRQVPTNTITLTTDQLQSLCLDAWTSGINQAEYYISRDGSSKTPIDFTQWFSKNVTNNNNIHHGN